MNENIIKISNIWGMMEKTYEENPDWILKVISK